MNTFKRLSVAIALLTAALPTTALAEEVLHVTIPSPSLAYLGKVGTGIWLGMSTDNGASCT